MAPNTFWYYYHIPKKELYDYLRIHANLVGVIHTDLYGDIKIYRFKWE